MTIDDFFRKLTELNKSIQGGEDEMYKMQKKFDALIILYGYTTFTDYENQCFSIIPIKKDEENG